MRINKQTIKLIPAGVFKSPTRIGNPNDFTVLYGIDVFSFIFMGRELVLDYTTYSIFPTDEVALSIVSQNGLALRVANLKQAQNRKIVLAAVKNNGAALVYASDDCKRDYEIVATAVETCARSLQFMMHPFTASDAGAYSRLVIHALEYGIGAIRFISWQLIPNKYIKEIKNAMRGALLRCKNFRSKIEINAYFEYFREIYDDPPLDVELILHIISQKPSYILAVKSICDYEFMKKAVRANGFVLYYISAETLTRDDILAAVKNNGRALCHTSAGADREIVLAAVSNYGPALQHASDALKSDPEILLAATLNSIYALDYVKNVTYELLLKLAPKWGFSILRAKSAICALSNVQIHTLYKKCVIAEDLFMRDLIELHGLTYGNHRLAPMQIPLPNFVYRYFDIERFE